MNVSNIKIPHLAHRLITLSLALLLQLGICATEGIARPEYFARYRADPFARPELNTCAVCHENAKGGGPRNEFGSAFSRANRQFTAALRTEYPDRFMQDRARLGKDVEIVFEGTDGKTILVRQGDKTYRVTPASKDVATVAGVTSAPRDAAAGAAPADSGGGSPVFDYQFVNLRTARVLDKGEFHFRFSHRFTTPVFNQGRREFDLFGLDSFALTGLGVGYGVTNRFAVNVFRQRNDRRLEFSGDLSLLEQNESRSPISLMFRAAVDGKNDFASQDRRGHYVPSLQMVISRNLFDRLSLSVNPTFVFNLKRPDNNALENHLVAIGLGGSLKLRENLAIVGEFIPRVSGSPYGDDFLYNEPTASFGLQFRTHRHVFALVFSNSWDSNIAGSALGGPDEKHIGFNIFRRIK